MNKSKTFERRVSELKQKEKLLLQGLDVDSKKLKKVALWSLGAGLISLIIYGIYTWINPDNRPKKKKKKTPKKSKVIADNWFTDALVEQVVPRIGKWILKEFRDDPKADASKQ